MGNGGRLSAMFGEIREQIRVVKERDPAARNWLEIILCYPGLHAVLTHRIAHWLWNHRFCTLARVISQLSRHFTKIEIHPAAEIGKRLFIDHGCGLVIGETAEIGDDCTLFHGVTLGGTGKETGKRHPTLHNNVTICADAQILGSITIGDNSVVGAGAVVLDPVPPNCTVVGVKARVVRREGKRVYDFRHDNLPDPDEVAMECILEVVRSLTVRTRKLDAENKNLRAELDGITAANERVQQQVKQLDAELALSRKSIDRLASTDGRTRELQEQLQDLQHGLAALEAAQSEPTSPIA